MKPKTKEAAKLLRLAQQDREAFDILRREMASDATPVFFHAQQCVEKCLKAVIAHLGRSAPPTHNLMFLAQILKKASIEIPVPLGAMTKLIPYAVAFRYDEVDFMVIDAASAARIVEAIYQWAKGMLERTSDQGTE